jgi:hypothetical protein
MAVDATQNLSTVSAPTLSVSVDTAYLELDDIASEPFAQPTQAWSARSRRDELEALGLVLGVLSILLALAVGLGATPAF